MTAKPTKTTGRRRMRIRAVTDEWARNPLLLAVPALIVLLAAVADSALLGGYFHLAQTFSLLSRSGIVVLLALLGVAFVRL